MALIGNVSVLTKSPGRWLGGATVSGERSNWNKSSSARAMYVGYGGLYQKSARPDGYRPPYSNIIAVKTGGMALHTYEQNAGATLSGAIAGGLNAAADLAGSGDITSADLALIVSAAATIVAGGDLTADMVGKLEALATITGNSDLTAGIGALASATADVAGTGNMTATARATGELDADIQPFTELSPESLARAVWTLRAAGFDAGSFGANLDAPISTIGGGSITEEGIAEVLMTDPRFLSVAKFLGLK